MSIQVKICGVNHPDAIRAAIAGAARYVGFVFYEKSPRCVAPPLAAELSRLLPTGIRAVGLFVEPGDELLDHVLSQVPLDLIQLHGDETPARVAQIRHAFGIPVMKAIKIGSPDDLAGVGAYAEVADRLLFDAKPPPKVSALPGGNGIAFDWAILAGCNWSRPWMLSGGLTAATLPEAVAITGAKAVDVSSGVEDRPGHKSARKIHEFLRTASQL